MKYLHTLVPFDYLRLFLPAIFLVAGASVCADAQGIFGEPPHESYRYGGALLGGYANHSANFQTIPGYPNCCPQFTGGGGLSFILAGQFERTVGDAPNMWIGIRTGLQRSGGTLTAREQSIRTTITTAQGTEQARIDHTVVSSLTSIMAEPFFAVNVLPKAGLTGGLNFALPVAWTFDQRERLADDQDGVFGNGLRTRNEFLNQRIPSTPAIAASVFLGVRYELPLNSAATVLALPELRFMYAISAVSTAIDWKVSAVQAGVAVLYSPRVPPVMRYDTIIRRDTVITYEFDIPAVTISRTHDSLYTRSEEVALNTFLVTREEYQTYTKTIPKKRPYYFEPAMQVRAVDAEKNEQDMVTIRIEEVIGNSIRPLLPYVFFEENTDTLPARYNRIASTETSNFTVNNLRKRNTLQIYHHVLNIIGKRLREYPNAVLTLTGCNTDMDAEHGNTQLSKRRAEAVRDYLQQAWQVDAKRLVIKAQNLPRVPSSAKSQDGIDENRRVEIASSVAEVLQNIVLLDTTLRTESVSSLRIYPSVKSSAGIAAWRIRGSVLDTITKSFQSSTDSLPAAIEWNVNEQLAQAIEHPQKIGITMELRDRKDSVSTVTASTPVQLITKRDRERIDNKYVDTYSLILYDFGTYTHTAAHEKMLKYIRVHSTPKSTMIITGHTDRSGSNDYNRMLSTKRAEFTAKALNVPMSNVTGYGEEQELYDNNLPEGRMYNRTVNITVETPVE